LELGGAVVEKEDGVDVANAVDELELLDEGGGRLGLTRLRVKF
jgi:hypothetical protein